MIDIPFSFSGISAFLGTVSGVLFFFFKSNDNRRLNIILGMLFIIFARFLAFSPLFKSNYTAELDNAFLSRPLYFLIMPGLFFYISFGLGIKRSWNKKDFLHLIPFFIFLIDILFLYLVPGNVKANLFVSIGVDYQVIFNGYTGFLPSFLFFTSILIQFHSYQYFLLRYFSKHDFAFRHLFRHWFSLLLFAVSMIFLLIEIRGLYIYTMTRFSVGDFSNVFLIVNKSLILLLFNGVWIVYIVKYLSGTIFLDNPAEEVEEEVFPIKKKEEKSIPQEEFELIQQKLAYFFDTSTQYFDTSFNINRLAMEIGIPSSLLTKYFNQFLGMRYNHAINKVRIEKLLKLYDDENSTLKLLTIEAVGNKMGFSSKSSFYAAFAREMGCTPTEYFARKQE